MLWMTRLYAKMTRQRVVWLEDFDGEVNYSIANVTPFGRIMAKRFTSYVICMPDGSTVGPCYVKKWMWDA